MDYKSFDWQTYLYNYDDLKKVFKTKFQAWIHWIKYGIKEGRTYKLIIKPEDVNEYEKFDWTEYIKSLNNLSIKINSKEKAWIDWVTNGKKEFRIKNKFKIIDKKKKIISVYDNFILDINNIFFSNNNTKDIDFMLDNIEPLEEIFNRNNIDYTNIKFIELSIPKSGSQGLDDYFTKIDQGLLIHFHSIIELIYSDIGFIHYNINDIITFIKNNTKHAKIYVISSYRHPFTRIVSKFHWNAKIENISLTENDTIRLNDLSNKILIEDYQVVYNDILMGELDINFSLIKYDKELGAGIFQKDNKLEFIFTCLEDLNKFYLNTDKIFETIDINILKNTINNEIINVNTNNNYIETKKKFEFNSETKNYLLEKENIMIKFYQY